MTATRPVNIELRGLTQARLWSERGAGRLENHAQQTIRTRLAPRVVRQGAGRRSGLDLVHPRVAGLQLGLADLLETMRPSPATRRRTASRCAGKACLNSPRLVRTRSPSPSME